MGWLRLGSRRTSWPLPSPVPHRCHLPSPWCAASSGCDRCGSRVHSSSVRGHAVCETVAIRCCVCTIRLRHTTCSYVGVGRWPKRRSRVPAGVAPSGRGAGPTIVPSSLRRVCVAQGGLAAPPRWVALLAALVAKLATIPQSGLTAPKGPLPASAVVIDGNHNICPKLKG